MNGSARPRVLLVDDDAAIRRLVTLTLEDLDIELLTSASVEQALAVLRAAPVRLLIVDLMMPGITGLELLQQLQADPALRGGARLAVYSAGLTAATRAQLAELDVWRALDKPVSVRQLEALVVDALGLPAAGTSTPAPATAEPPLLSAGEQLALTNNFGGDLALFTAFRSTAWAQLDHDIGTGHRAMAAADLATLHRLAHSLKSVLLILGHEAAASQARQLEACAARGDTAAGTALWQGLCAALSGLRPERRNQ
jgi:CheY-like chemotaxis protein